MLTGIWNLYDEAMFNIAIIWMFSTSFFYPSVKKVVLFMVILQKSVFAPFKADQIRVLYTDLVVKQNEILCSESFLSAIGGELKKKTAVNFCSLEKAIIFLKRL